MIPDVSRGPLDATSSSSLPALVSVSPPSLSLGRRYWGAILGFGLAAAAHFVAWRQHGRTGAESPGIATLGTQIPLPTPEGNRTECMSRHPLRILYECC